MKNTVKSFLLLLGITVLFVTCSACHDDTRNENLSTEKQIWLPYTTVDHREACKKTHYYDEYGNEIKTVKQDLNGNLESTWLYEYDDNHNFIKKSVDVGDGTPFVQLIQTYDDNGNLIEKREISTSSETVFTFKYDEQNRCISKSIGNEIVETYTYEADGSYKVQKLNSAEEYSLYGADGKILERHLSSDSKWVYRYNENGILVECATYSGDNISRTTVYHLDEYGNAVKVTEVRSSGTEEVLGEYEYKQYTVKVK